MRMGSNSRRCPCTRGTAHSADHKGSPRWRPVRSRTSDRSHRRCCWSNLPSNARTRRVRSLRSALATSFDRPGAESDGQRPKAPRTIGYRNPQREASNPRHTCVRFRARLHGAFACSQTGINSQREASNGSLFLYTDLVTRVDHPGPPPRPRSPMTCPLECVGRPP